MLPGSMRACSLALCLLASLLSGCGLLRSGVSTGVGMGMGAVGTGLALAQSLLPLAGSKFTLQCLPEGTLIDTPEGPRAVETIRAHDTVTGYEGRPVRVLMVHQYAEDPAEGRFLELEFSGGAAVTVCDMHRITGIRAGELQPGDRVHGRLLERVQPIEGVTRSFDLLTEDPGYRVGGIPVNSMIEELVELSRTGQLRP